MRKFRVLVLVEDYPDNYGNVSLMYVHTRNLYYSENDVDVTVLNFEANENYIFEGIPVITRSEYNKNKLKDKYDLLIVHAANIRHHYLFLKKNQKDFRRILFFYHGHEVLKLNKVYSKPYQYVRHSVIKSKLQDIYDDLKLLIWRKYIPKLSNKSQFVFVSKWMEDEFYKWTKISPSILAGKTYITYNCIGKDFEMETYKQDIPKEYDFITIRSNLDGSKYAVDLVYKWAQNTPQAKFLIIGKGEFFKQYRLLDNITWINRNLSHKELLKYLDISRFALMPTRTDAQGLMMCEMAAYGIPVITSDIPVCHEIFDGFSNAYLLSNIENRNLNKYLNFNGKCIKDVRFYKKNTLNNELRIIKNICQY